MTDVLTVNDEIDLTDDGIPTTQLLFTITDPKEEATENGTRAVLVFENREAGVFITQRYWLQHNNEQAQKIGRRQLREIFVKATGSPKVALAALDGAQLYATPREKDGFVNLSRVKSVEEVNEAE